MTDDLLFAPVEATLRLTNGDECLVRVVPNGMNECRIEVVSEVTSPWLRIFLMHHTTISYNYHSHFFSPLFVGRRTPYALAALEELKKRGEVEVIYGYVPPGPWRPQRSLEDVFDA